MSSVFLLGDINTIAAYTHALEAENTPGLLAATERFTVVPLNVIAGGVHVTAGEEIAALVPSNDVTLFTYNAPSTLLRETLTRELFIRLIYASNPPFVEGETTSGM